MSTGVSFQNASYFGGGVNTSVFTPNGGLSVSSFFNEEYLNQKYSYQEKKESYELGRTARDTAINSKVSNIISYVKSGQEDKAIAAYNELIEIMKSQDRYSTFAQNEAELRAIARSIIESNLEGESLEEVIRKNTRTASQVKSQNIQTYGNCDHTSQEQLLKEMCDIDEEEGGANLLEAAWAVVSSPFVWLGNAIFGGGKKM